MLLDAADPRYGGSPDPDDERRRRWQPLDKRIVLPAMGSVACLIGAGVSGPEVAYGLTFAAAGLCGYMIRAARPQRSPSPSPGEDAVDDDRAD